VRVRVMMRLQIDESELKPGLLKPVTKTRGMERLFPYRE